MSKRWVYCPLCEGWNMVHQETGKEHNCPACGGAGMVNEASARRIRRECADDAVSIGLFKHHRGPLAEALHRKLVKFTAGYRREREGMSVAIARAADQLHARQEARRNALNASVRNIVIMPGGL